MINDQWTMINEQWLMINEQKTSLKFVKFILFSFFCGEKLLEYKKHVIRKKEATFQTQREKINKWV